MQEIATWNLEVISINQIPHLHYGIKEGDKVKINFSKDELRGFNHPGQEVQRLYEKKKTLVYYLQTRGLVLEDLQEEVTVVREFKLAEWG